MSLPASFELACALKRVPDDFRESDVGIIKLIRIAVAFGWNDPLFGGSRNLVRLAVQANYERGFSRGKGMNAKRREARMDAEFESAQDTLADRMALEGAA